MEMRTDEHTGKTTLRVIRRLWGGGSQCLTVGLTVGLTKGPTKDSQKDLQETLEKRCIYSSPSRKNRGLLPRYWSRPRGDNRMWQMTQRHTRTRRHTDTHTHTHTHTCLWFSYGCPRKVLFLHWFYKVVREKGCFYIGFIRLPAGNVVFTLVLQRLPPKMLVKPA